MHPLLSQQINRNKKINFLPLQSDKMRKVKQLFGYILFDDFNFYSWKTQTITLPIKLIINERHNFLKINFVKINFSSLLIFN